MRSQPNIDGHNLQEEGMHEFLSSTRRNLSFHRSPPRDRPESSGLGSGPIVEEVPPVRFPLYPPGSWIVARWNLTNVV